MAWIGNQMPSKMRGEIIYPLANFNGCNGYIYLTHWGRDKMDAFADDIFKCIFFIENVWIPIKISLKFVPKGPIDNIPELF